MSRLKIQNVYFSLKEILFCQPLSFDGSYCIVFQNFCKFFFKNELNFPFRVCTFHDGTEENNTFTERIKPLQ